MAKLTFDIPDARMPEFIDAWAEGYQDTIDGAPNPQTKQQFARQQIRNALAGRVHAYQSIQPPTFPIADA